MKQHLGSTCTKFAAAEIKHCEITQLSFFPTKKSKSLKKKKKLGFATLASDAVNLFKLPNFSFSPNNYDRNHANCLFILNCFALAVSLGQMRQTHSFRPLRPKAHHFLISSFLDLMVTVSAISRWCFHVLSP